MDVVASLIADGEPAVLRKPGQCALYDPPVAPNFSLLSTPFLAIRLLMERFLRASLHFLSS